MTLTWIYILRDPDTGCFKVGKSKHPLRRIKELQKQPTLLARPFKFELVVAWWLPESEERHIHQMMSDFRVRGEWFKFSNYEIGELRAWYADCDTHPNSTNSDRRGSPQYRSSANPMERMIREQLLGGGRVG